MNEEHGAGHFPFDFRNRPSYFCDVKIPVEELRRISIGVLGRHGLNEDDARIVSDVILEAELRGRPAHGLVRLPGIAERVAEKKRTTMRLARPGGTCTLVDGKGNLGYLVAHRCARTVAQKARKYGLGLVGAFNTDGCGMIGYYVSLVVETGLVCLMTCDSSPRTVPWGATEPVLGANPLALGFPYEKGQILVDLSTSAITTGDVLMAMKSGSRIPEGCALDSSGRMTTDPEAALRGAALPFGGHKGYALGLAVQILSSVLVCAAPIPDPGENYGILMLAIKPTIFASRESFATGLAEIVARVKSARRVDPSVEVLIPGERAFRQREQRLSKGIEVDLELLEEVQKLAK